VLQSKFPERRFCSKDFLYRFICRFTNPLSAIKCALHFLTAMSCLPRLPLAFAVLFLAVACRADEVDRMELYRREFYKSAGIDAGNWVGEISGLQMVGLCLGGEPLGREDRRCVWRLVSAEDSEKRPAATLWNPSEKEIRAAVALVKTDKQNLKALKALTDRPGRFACQAIGIVLDNEKKLILNFVPERTLGYLSFYLSPVFYYDLNWPSGGSVLCDLKKQKVIWVHQP
jgi:hypothetical protein